MKSLLPTLESALQAGSNPSVVVLLIQLMVSTKAHLEGCEMPWEQENRHTTNRLISFFPEISA